MRPQHPLLLCFVAGVTLWGIAALQDGRADQYVGTCVCDYDGEGLSCHAAQTVRGESLDALARTCAAELGPRASVLHGSIRAEKDVTTELEQDAANNPAPVPPPRPRR